MPPETPPHAEPSTAIFDPLKNTNEDVWFPGTTISSQLVSCQHIWEDILRLSALRRASHDEYNRKLLLKYIVMEAVSMLTAMDALRAAVMTAEVYTPPARPPFRGISIEEKSRALTLWDSYSIARKAVEQEITAIRNKIAAHRDVQDWGLWMQLWEKLEPSLIEGLLAAIPPAFNHTKELNIFDWNINHGDGTITLLGGPVGPWMFDDDENIDSPATT